MEESESSGGLKVPSRPISPSLSSTLVYPSTANVPAVANNNTPPRTLYSNPQDGQSTTNDDTNPSNSEDAPQSSSSPPLPPPKESGIMAESNDVQPITVDSATPMNPQVTLTLLLVSGRRRNMGFDPDTDIAKLKEIVWNTWPSEWSDEQPPSAAFLRVLYLGRILQDDTTLSSLGLAPSHEPTVFHISVRSFATAGADDHDLKKRSRRSRSRRATSNNVSATGTNDVPDANDMDDRGPRCCGCVIC